METWHIIVALIVLAIVAAALKGKGGSRRSYDYKPTPLLTKGERAFASAIQECLPPGARLLAKVRLADLITPTSARDRGAFLKISQKHVDFVIAAADWSVLAAVELNDKSHDAQHRRERDDFIRKACEGAGIRLHFVRAAARYDLAELRVLLLPPSPPAADLPPPPPAPPLAR
jgi:hypothetical protein